MLILLLCSGGISWTIQLDGHLAKNGVTDFSSSDAIQIALVNGVLSHQVIQSLSPLSRPFFSSLLYWYSCIIIFICSPLYPCLITTLPFPHPSPSLSLLPPSPHPPPLQNTVHNWYSWANNKWNLIASPLTSCPSPCGTTVPLGSKAAIIDNNGKRWTLTSSGTFVVSHSRKKRERESKSENQNT